jgi:hypothetical protein
LPATPDTKTSYEEIPDWKSYEMFYSGGYVAKHSWITSPPFADFELFKEEELDVIGFKLSEAYNTLN